MGKGWRRASGGAPCRLDFCPPLHTAPKNRQNGCRVRRKPNSRADEKCIVDDCTVHEAAARQVDVEPVTHDYGDAVQHKLGHRLAAQYNGGGILEWRRVDELGEKLRVKVCPSVRLLEQREGALKLQVAADLLARRNKFDLHQPAFAVLRRPTGALLQHPLALDGGADPVADGVDGRELDGGCDVERRACHLLLLLRNVILPVHQQESLQVHDAGERVGHCATNIAWHLGWWEHDAVDGVIISPITRSDDAMAKVWPVGVCGLTGGLVPTGLLVRRHGGEHLPLKGKLLVVRREAFRLIQSPPVQELRGGSVLC